MAKFYDRIMQDAEAKGLGEWRKSLLENVSGDVLELGAGTGANLLFYPPTIKRLILSEPNASMRRQLKQRITANTAIEVLSDEAECLTLPNESMDVVVSTLVLCSVNNLEKALAEIYRVLRPDGKLIFIEHVLAVNNSQRYRWQRRLAFVWKHLMGNCHISRDTEKAILAAKFQLLDIQHQSMRGVPAIVRPSIRGIAIKSR
jgi:ubiquinone/menaquinone biosynthesis C-methylase UbiE